MTDGSRRLEDEYDALAFPNAPQLKTHPDNMATLAALFGVAAPPIEHCRVLELGCGSGDNLLAMAMNMPVSHYVGVDLSRVHLDRGRDVAKRLGLRNIQFEHADITTLDPDKLGTFDYIICHGVFSWVPPDVQDAILWLAGETLSPNGVFYLSYNAYPGWHLLNMLRQMLLHDAPPNASPQERVRRARNTLGILRAAASLPYNSVGAALGEKMSHLQSQSDGYLFHEYLTEHNEGFWFEEVVRRAGQHGMQYLANAVPETMEASNFGHAIANAVAACPDRVSAQQRLNMALGTPFNSTLFCRAEHDVRRTFAATTIESLYYDGWLHPDPSEGDVHESEHVTVTSSTGIAAKVTGADLRTALGVLARARPCNVHFDVIYDAVKQSVPGDGRSDEVRRRELSLQLVRLYFGAVIGISTHAPPLTADVSDHPIASPLARLQASEQGWVTSQWHMRVLLTAPQRDLLARLDGGYAPLPRERDILEFLGQQALLVG